ncbi:Hypothetical predicted protein [Mytilus galloprovincialis]|uniref:Uncharacterized protein n=1 Tax=Mytilus galloprovincialis TaxID=29158 RepID=A0A8B6DEZ4_MYTGA|nr:Hypothetical predicted protein [Mytilus galloprovincialis]
MPRIQQKAENDLAKLKIDHVDAQIKVKTLTDQRDEVSRKQQGEIDRLKFQVEFMMKQNTMVLPVEVVGLSVCKESFNSCLMLVAIEIGSLYSGCCFSFKGLYTDSERHGFVSPQLYTEGKFQMKIPTAVLLNSKKEFECIGVEANKYKKEFVSEGWFYFTKFKTMLARSKVMLYRIEKSLK